MHDQSPIRSILALDLVNTATIQRRLHLSYSNATALIEYLKRHNILEPTQCYRVNLLSDHPPNLPMSALTDYLEERIRTLETHWQNEQNTP